MTANSPIVLNLFESKFWFFFDRIIAVLFCLKHFIIVVHNYFKLGSLDVVIHESIIIVLVINIVSFN